MRKSLKMLVAASLIGSSCLWSVALPSESYAAEYASKHVKKIYQDTTPYSTKELIKWKLETDTIDGDVVGKGIHYVTAWVQVYERDASLSLVPVVGSLFSGTNSFGHFELYVMKFEDNGDYETFIAVRKDAQKSDDRTGWKEEMVEFATKDEANPHKWKELQENSYWVAEKVADYIKEHHPDIVANNIALNKRDEAAAIAVLEENIRKQQEAAQRQKLAEERKKLEDKIAKKHASESVILAKHGAKANNPVSASEKDTQLMSGWDYTFRTRESYRGYYSDFSVKSENPNALGFVSKDGLPLPNLWINIRNLDQHLPYMPRMVGFTYDSATDTFDVYVDGDDDDENDTNEDRGIFEKRYKIKILSPDQMEVTYLVGQNVQVAVSNNTAQKDATFIFTRTKESEEQKQIDSVFEPVYLPGFFVYDKDQLFWLQRCLTDALYEFHGRK